MQPDLFRHQSCKILKVIIVIKRKVNEALEKEWPCLSQVRNSRNIKVEVENNLISKDAKRWPLFIRENCANNVILLNAKT